MKLLSHLYYSFHFFTNKKSISTFISLSLFSFNQSVFCQTLIPLAESAFESQLPFNTEYIKKENIKSITFEILDKKDLEVAEDKGLLNYYEFYPTGKLKRYFYTTISKIIQKEFYSEPIYKRGRKISNGHSYTKNHYILDTISTFYFYENSSNQLSIKRYNEGSYYETFYYTYFKDGNQQSEKRCKETNLAESKNDFKLGVQYILSEESYSYTPISTNQLKKKCINNEGRPYKDIIINTNNSKQLVSTNEQYIATWIKQESSFTYNSKGQLTSAFYKSNTGSELTEKRTYEYDANDCLLTERKYKNDVLLQETSYVTDSNKRLNSYIIRDSANKSLRIVKLFYN